MYEVAFFVVWRLLTKRCLGQRLLCIGILLSKGEQPFFFVSFNKQRTDFNRSILGFSKEKNLLVKVRLILLRERVK